MPPYFKEKTFRRWHSENQYQISFPPNLTTQQSWAQAAIRAAQQVPTAPALPSLEAGSEKQVNKILNNLTNSHQLQRVAEGKRLMQPPENKENFPQHFCVIPEIEKKILRLPQRGKRDTLSKGYSREMFKNDIAKGIVFSTGQDGGGKAKMSKGLHFLVCLR